MRLTFNSENGKDMRRAARREAEQRSKLKTRKAYAARTKGLYLHDDDELIEIVNKRNHCEQKGRLRLIKGAVPHAFRNVKRDAETLAQDIAS